LHGLKARINSAQRQRLGFTMHTIHIIPSQVCRRQTCDGIWWLRNSNPKALPLGWIK